MSKFVLHILRFSQENTIKIPERKIIIEFRCQFSELENKENKLYYYLLREDVKYIGP